MDEYGQDLRRGTNRVLEKIRPLFAGLLATALLACVLLTNNCEAARIKDIANINGVRPNILIGYGLVVGLKGTGDKRSTYSRIRRSRTCWKKWGLS